MAEWTADSNEALHLSLVRAEEDKQSLAQDESYDFHPTFTYPIYGEDEKIYGYKDLKIDLQFASGSLAQLLKVSYTSKLPSASTVDQVEEKLQEVLPDDYYTDKEAFLKRVEDDATSFKPIGTKIYSYTRPDPASTEKGKGKGVVDTSSLDPNSEDAVDFEVYHATWDTPGFREYHRRMQIFILLYIEAGSYISEDEDQWEFVVLYEKRKRRNDPKTVTYHFAGYSSLYKFYFYPEKIRLRLSQFVIVPPYQHKGHGAALYTSIYEYVLSKPSMGELTVEDPAEAFEDLRDRVDLKMLLNHSQFKEEALGSESHGGGRVRGVGKHGRSGRGGASAASKKGKIGPPTDKVWAERWRVNLKMAKRQFDRLIEMLILLRIDPDDAPAMKAYRLQVKERLYRFNYEILAQLEKEERLEKLAETFETVREDYARILVMLH